MITSNVWRGAFNSSMNINLPLSVTCQLLFSQLNINWQVQMNMSLSINIKRYYKEVILIKFYRSTFPWGNEHSDACDFLGVENGVLGMTENVIGNNIQVKHFLSSLSAFVYNILLNAPRIFAMMYLENVWQLCICL